METHQLLTEYGLITYHLKVSSSRWTMLIRIKDAVYLYKEEVLSSRRSSSPVLVDVIVPKNVRAQEIHAFLHEKSRWIIEKSAEVKKKLLTFPKNTYIDGSELYFLGGKYPLQVIPQKILRSRISFDQMKWTILVPEKFLAVEQRKEVKKQFFDWYKNEAKEIFGARVFHFSRVLGIEPLKITIRTQKRIWGSCHYRERAIHLNWQIVLAPLSVVDYVIVHELSHLKVPNHSRKFWRTVEAVLPDYRKENQWLKENQQKILLSVHS